MIQETYRFWILLFGMITSVSVFGQAGADTLGLTGTMADTVVARRLFTEATLNYNNRNYNESTDLLLKSKSIIEPLLGKENNTYLKILEQLIPSCFFSKQLDRSEEVTNEYLLLATKMFGQNHITRANAYRYLGNINFARHKFAESIEKYKSALDVYSNLTSKEQASSYKIYNVMAKAFDEMGKDNDAIIYFEKAINGCELYFRDTPMNCAYITASLSSLYSDLDSLEKSNHYLRYLLNLYEKAEKNDEEKIRILDELGRNYLKLGDPDSAIIFHNYSLKTQTELFGDDEQFEKGFTFNGLGLCFFEKGDYEKALYFAKESLRIRQNNDGENSKHVSFSLTNIANCYYMMGDMEKALRYYLASSEIEKSIPNYDLGEIAKNYNNIGVVYNNMKDYKMAIFFHESAIKARESQYGENHTDVAESYSNLGIYYLAKGEPEKSIYYKEKALSIYLKVKGPDHAAVGTYYTGIGNCYLKMRAYDKAIEFYEKSLMILLKTVGDKHPYVANVYSNIANAYERKGDFKSAIEYCQKSLLANRYTSEIMLGNVMSIQELITTLNIYGLAYTEQYNRTNDPDFLTQAYDIYNTILNVVTYQFKAFTTESAKAELLKNSLSASENALYINRLLSEETHDKKLFINAFDHVEKAKSLILFGSLRESEGLSYAEIPDSLLEKERKLRIDITYNEKKRFEEEKQGKGTKSVISNINNNLLFGLHRDYEALKDTLETRYPDYYRLKYDLSTVSLDDVQNNLLQPGQTLLEYFTGDSAIYIFVVRPDTFHVVEVKKDFPLEDWVKHLRHGLTDYHVKNSKSPVYLDSTAREYVAAASDLYQKLIAPVAGLLDSTVVIVPDGVLGYVPFDVLLSEKPAVPTRFHSHSYFGKEKRISYAYSATLLREMRDKHHKKLPTESLLALAPFFRGDVKQLHEQVDTLSDLLSLRRDTLAALPASGREALVVAKIYDGKALLGDDSPKEILQKEAGHYRILHLSTHGKADDKVGDYAYLGFAMPGDALAFDKFYAKDIYNLALNADLVTLSACETGIGELKRGEGIISLARAFAYAGAKSIVTTLWSVNDTRTGELMEGFYKNLYKGMDKDVALWQAKKDFIAAHKKDAAHPYFWAGFIPIGDMRAIEEN